MHAVACAQPRDGAVQIGAEDRELLTIVDERLPNVDIGRAVLPGGVAKDFVEFEQTIGQPLVPHYRHADPDQRDVFLAQNAGESLCARRINLAPARHALIDRGCAVAQRLPVIAAERQNDSVDLFGRCIQFARGFYPVKVIVAHKAGVLARLAQNRHVGLAGEALLQALRKHEADIVAQNRNSEARPLNGHRRRGRLDIGRGPRAVGGLDLGGRIVLRRTDSAFLAHVAAPWRCATNEMGGALHNARRARLRLHALAFAVPIGRSRAIVALGACGRARQQGRRKQRQRNNCARLQAARDESVMIGIASHRIIIARQRVLIICSRRACVA